MKRPFVILGAGIVAGISSSALWVQSLYIYIFFFIFAGVVGTCVFYRYGKGLLVFLFLLGVGIGGVRYLYVDSMNVSHLDHYVKNASLRMIGEIASPPVIDGDHLSFNFSVKRVLVGRPVIISDEKVRVHVKLKHEKEWKKAHHLKRYDLLVTSMRLEKIALPRNPGAFHYRDFLYRKGIHVEGRVGSFSNITLLKKSSHPFVWIDSLRAFLGEKIEKIYPAEYSGTIRGMVLGERAQVDPKLVDDYTTLGIIHLLSISGLHVGVFVGSLYFLFMFFGLTRERAAFFICVFLPIYTLLTGAGAPVIRASMMAMLMLSAIMLRGLKDTLSFLALALILQLTWNPYQLFEAGFQLSYIITAVLIMGVQSVAESIPTPWNGLNQLISVTIVSQIASFPILLFHFHSFSFLSGLVNFIAVPLFSLIAFPLALLSLVISFFSQTLGECVGYLSTLCLDLVQCLSKMFLSFPFSNTNFRTPSLIGFLCYIGGAIYLFIAVVGDLFYKKKHLIISSMCFLTALFYVGYAHIWFNDETRVTFLDVGQGDCVVIETKEGKVILVDGGGSPLFSRSGWMKKRRTFDIGSHVVLPYLTYRGINKIDYLVMTHGDSDHIGGLQAVCEKISVQHVIRNNHRPHSSVEKKLMNTLSEKGVKIYVPPLGLELEIEKGIKWKFLHPDPHHPLGDDQKSNDDSIVCLFWIYGKKVLLTGDIGIKAEQEVMDHWDTDSIDVLKVAHHGSKYSTHEAWLDVVKPKEAVISVGEKNRYGHPTKEVLHRLKAHRIPFFRTDQEGAIVYHFRSSSMKRECVLRGIGTYPTGG